MESDIIKKRYMFNEKLTQKEIDTSSKEKYDSYNFIKVFSPIYFIDLFGTGWYSKIDDSNVPYWENIILKYKYFPKNDNGFFDFFSIVRNYEGPKKGGGEILYKGFPIYNTDSNGHIYFPPQKDILYLNEKATSEFFENLMIDIINKDTEFKKKYM